MFLRNFIKLTAVVYELP